MSTRVAMSMMMSAVTFFVTVLGNDVHAQDNSRTETLYTFAFVRVPLLEALEVVMEETSLNLFFETDLVAGRMTFCSVNRKVQEDVLKCILRDTGLDFVRLSNGSYVITEALREAPILGQLYGMVVDRLTGLPLPDANVLIVGSNVGVATSRTGHFVFPGLLAGEHQVVITHVAYEDSVLAIVVGPEQERVVRVELNERTLQSRPIVVSGLSRRLPFDESLLSERSFDAIRETPGASVDMTRTLATIAGVQVHDALSTIHIQGGDAGEHEFRLDGVPVFLPIRNGGFVGPFSPFAIERISVYKAGFQASKGSATSGIIMAEHDISDNGFHTAAQFGPLSGSVRIGSSNYVGRSHVRWMASARRSLWSIIRNRQLNRRFKSWSEPSPYILDSINPDSAIGQQLVTLFDDGDVELKFRDIHAVAQVNRGLNRFYASVYSGYNVFGNDALETNREFSGAIRDEYEWFNTTITMEYDRVLSSRIINKWKFWKSGYILRHPFTVSPFEPVNNTDSLSREFNEIETFGARNSFDIAATARHKLRSDLDVTFMDDDFRLSVDPSGRIPAATPLNLNTAHWRWAASVEDEVSLSYKTTLIAGSRFTYMPLHKTLYIEPRVSLRHDEPFDDDRAVSILIAGGLYRQYLNQFDIAPYSVTAILPSFRFWIPLTENERPPSTIHASGEVLVSLSPAVSLSLESYYKKHLRLNTIDYSTFGGVDRPLTTISTGMSAGSSLSLSSTLGRYGGQITYVFNKSTVSTPGRFRDRSIDAPWSWPHQVRLGGDYTRGGFSATVKSSLVAGRSWGYQLGYYNYLEPLDIEDGPSFSDPEGDHLPLFFQVDAGLSYTVRVKLATVRFRATALNVLDRNNVVDWLLVYDAETSRYVRKDRYAIPFTPLVSMTITF